MRRLVAAHPDHAEAAEELAAATRLQHPDAEVTVALDVYCPRDSMYVLDPDAMIPDPGDWFTEGLAA